MHNPLHDQVCSINRQLHCSRIINIIRPLTVHESLETEEFQICIAAVSCAFWHATVLIMVHYVPSQIHYSLKTVIKIFPINQTTASRKWYDYVILERQLLLNTIFM